MNTSCQACLPACLPACSYYMSLGILCGFILAAMPWAALGLPNQLGRARKENVSFWALFRYMRPTYTGCPLHSLALLWMLWLGYYMLALGLHRPGNATAGGLHGAGCVTGGTACSLCPVQ